MTHISNTPTVVLQDKGEALHSFIEGEFRNSRVISANSQNWNDVDLTAQRVIYVVHHTARFDTVNFMPVRFDKLLEKNPEAVRIIAATPGTPENANPAPSETRVNGIAYQIETIWFLAGENKGRAGKTAFMNPQTGTLVETSEGSDVAPQWNKTRYAAKAAMALAGAAVVTFVALQMIAFLAPHYAAAHFTAPIQFLVTPLANALSGQTLGLMAAKIGGGSLLGAGGLFAFGGGIYLTLRQKNQRAE